MARITIRDVVEDLFKCPDLIIKYVETEDGGFDLNVRIVDVLPRCKEKEE